MDDDPVEFRLISRTKLLGIGGHRVEADEEVARNLLLLRIVEGDDIRIVIMLEILPINLQNMLI